jgi:hypothetical protein
MQCPTQHGDNMGILLDFCARRLSAARTLEIERHLELCAACRQAVESQQSVWNLLSEWEPEPTSADFDRRLYQRLEEPERTAWLVRLTGYVRAVWKPAIPVLLTAATALTFVFVREPEPAPAPAPRSAAVETLDVNQVEQTLDDLNMLRQMSPAPTSTQSM